jgi:hypothetical protein
MSRRSVRADGWRRPDALWAEMEPLLPERPQHPSGCHNPRVPDRSAMDAIFFVLRTGCQGNALNATGICSSSSAHRRFLEWTQAGVFAEFRRQGLLACDGVAGIDWSWLALDGAMGKAPPGGRAHPFLAQPLPPHPGPLGEPARHRPRQAPRRAGANHLAPCRPSGIGS